MHEPMKSSLEATVFSTPSTGNPEIDKQLLRVRNLLDTGDVESALQSLGKNVHSSPWLLNAVGVCQLRRKNHEQALDIFRGLVLQGGIHFRADAPAVFKVNFAVSLYAVGNVDGFASALHEVPIEDHPLARKYHEEYQAWRTSRSFVEKMSAIFGLNSRRPLQISEPLGDVW